MFLLNSIFNNIFWELDFFFFNNSFSSVDTVYTLYFLNIFLLKYSIFFIFLFFLFFYLIFNFSKIKNKEYLVNNYSNLLKFLSLYSFISSSFLFFIFIYIYLYVLVSYNNFFYNNIFLISPNYYLFGFKINFDFFGIILLFLSFVCGLLSIISLDNKIFFKNIKYLFYLNMFIIIVFFYVSSNNILILFISYELLLLPSFILVFFLSPSRKSTQASLYFLIWTQIGSFLVLCFVFYILSVTGSSNFFLIKNFVFTKYEIFFLSLLIFLGFGFKIPIWPFHYWLTKTHVESPSGFSMYLSGFLVKTALFGFFKLINLLGSEINSVLFSVLCILGIIDSSLKMWGQTDIKKLVAYGTIQEMNIIYLTFCWGDSNNIFSGILFCLTHSFLSVLMFFLVDCVYRRYFSRSVIELSGILQKTPNLAISIIVMCVFYSGLPGTLKFTSEFYIFSSFLEIAPFSSIFVIFIANCLGIIGFSKSWFNIIFGMSNFNKKQLVIDLTIKEFYVIYVPIFILFFFCFFPNIFF